MTASQEIKMINYEISHYIVQYRYAIFDDAIYQQFFYTEESAIEYITSHEKEWSMFRLLKVQRAAEYTHKWKDSLKYVM